MRTSVPLPHQNPNEAIPDVIGHFKNLAKGNDSALKTGGIESTKTASAPNLSPDAINERVGEAAAQYHDIVKDLFDDRPELHDLVDGITRGAGEALRALDQGDTKTLRDKKLPSGAPLLQALEGIVRLDGSRPSFLIQNGEINRNSSPLGAWGGALDTSADFLHQAIACVGRIDYPLQAPGYMGTGFLIHENLVVTNRHVLQAIAAPQEDGSWNINDEATIDFGHEFRVQAPSTRRKLKSVVFMGDQMITDTIDHNKFDLALIELEEATSPRDVPAQVLAVDATRPWPKTDETLWVIGYPARPAYEGYAPTLLEQLFASSATYGCKRLAPGLVMKPQSNFPTWSLAHDATTLGGNSGSVVLAKGREHLAASLHYGGRYGAAPLENWGHVLYLNLAQPNGCKTRSLTGPTFGECLDKWGAKIVDTLDWLNPSPFSNTVNA